MIERLEMENRRLEVLNEELRRRLEKRPPVGESPGAEWPAAEGGRETLR